MLGVLQSPWILFHDYSGNPGMYCETVIKSVCVNIRRMMDALLHRFMFIHEHYYYCLSLWMWIAVLSEQEQWWFVKLIKCNLLFIP